MDLNARVDVNCGRKDGRTEHRTPISHLAKAGATKKVGKHTGVPIHLNELDKNTFKTQNENDHKNHTKNEQRHHMS